jgi:hypothetical protein
MHDSDRNVSEQISSLKSKLAWNTTLLVITWIVFLIFSLCAFQSSPQSAPQMMRLHALRIVDDNGADVIRMETVNGSPLIQMKTATLATTIESGKISLDWKDADNNRSTSTIDFIDGSPRLLMTRPEGKQTLALGFDKTQPTIVLNDRLLDQINTLQSGSVVSQNGTASRRIALALGDDAGPAIRLIDKEGHSDRMGVLTSGGFGSKVDGATTELRTADGVQTMKLVSSDSKNSISLTVDKQTASAKATKQGKSADWMP